MKTFVPTRIQWLTLLLPLPFLIIPMIYLVLGDRVSDYESVMLLVIISIPFSTGSWYMCTIINNYISLRLPHQQQTLKRVLLLLFAHSAWIFILMSVIFFGLGSLPVFKGKFEPENFSSAVTLSLILNIIFCVIWQVEHIFKKLKESLSEKELMEQQYLQQEFDNLKQQINPHFLFNNLNVLSSLIAENPEKAVYFLDELSKVYRYLLKNGADGIATLKDELEFIRSYTALLKIRFGDTVHVQIHSAADTSGYLLPSLSLQLLIENAIKHNVANKSKPLKIEISVMDNEWLQVQNNLQKKPSGGASNKVGLVNINNKYKMLNMPDIKIKPGLADFVVQLPLIQNNL